jgi:hypothetical protein
MKQLWKPIVSILFYVMAGALMIYAASRSLHFVQTTLAGGNQIIGYLALAATSVGSVIWLLVFLHTAHGTGQKALAGLMTVLDLLGEFALFTIDTLMTSGETGMIQALAPEEIQGVIIGMSILIALNIAATVAFHLVEPENMKNMREAAVRDKLEDDSLKLIEKHGEELSRKMAPRIAEQWAKDFEARFSDLQSLGLGTVNKAPENPETGLVFPWGKKNKALPHPQDGEAEAFDETDENLELETVPAFSPNGHNGNSHKPGLFSGNGNGHKPGKSDFQ